MTLSSHQQSKRALEEKWNFFLCYTKPGAFKVFGGLDLRRYSHLTTAILYRWLELLDSNPNKRRFQLWRISVQNYDVLRYTGKRVGDDPLPRDPAMSLEPGDYAAYYENTPHPTAVGLSPRSTFPERETLYRKKALRFNCDPERLVDNELPPDIISSVLQRDNAKCFVSGRTTTQICWIFPPAWIEEINPSEDGLPDPNKEQIMASRTLHNAIMLAPAILEPFASNMIGIDVDDGYRIVVFKDLPNGLILPNSCLATVGSAQVNVDRFLRYHFKWSLQANILGGDIREDYPDDGEDLMIKAMEDGVDLEDPVWQTVLGKQIVEIIVGGKIREECEELDFDEQV